MGAEADEKMAARRGSSHLRLAMILGMGARSEAPSDSPEWAEKGRFRYGPRTGR